MKVKPVAILVILAAALLLSGCSGASLPTNSWPGLAATDKVAYLASGSFVYAISLSNQSELWRFPSEADAEAVFFTDPVLTDDGQLIIGSAGKNNTLYSIDAATGVEKWSFANATMPWMGDVLATADAIFAPNTDGMLYALDPQTGNLIWKSNPAAGDAIWGQPATDGERVYYGSLDHFLYALDAKTGQEAWKVELKGAVVGSPVVSPDGLVYIGSLSEAVEALDPQTGSVKWTAPTEDWVWSGLTMFENTLYIGDLSGAFYALDAANGSQIWAPQQPNGPVVSRPLVIANAIIFGAEDGKTIAVDFDGKPLWTHAIEGKIYTTPVQAGDLILIAPMEAESALIALNAQGGEAWTFSPEK